MKPTKPITDPTFAYTSSTHTDIRKTFARIAAEQEAAKAAQEQERAEVNRRYRNAPMLRKVPK